MQPQRLLGLQTETLVKQRGSNRHGDGQVVRVDLRPHDARIKRWQLGIHFRRFAAGGQKRNAVGQQPKQPLQILLVAGQHVKGHQHHRRLLRREDPGLVRAVERLLLPAFILGDRQRFRRFICRLGQTTAAQRQYAQPQSLQ
ncbi:hypothetical protein D3C80_1140300 [compost metagenome]